VDPTEDLTVGAALIVGWVLGTVYALTVLRLGLKVLRDTRKPETEEPPPE
jgi:hypothetical protein